MIELRDIREVILMRKLFKGGTVVSGKGTKRADVLVDGEKIVRVARSITDPLAQTGRRDGQVPSARLYRRAYAL